jgi:hypothetical protein
MGYQEQLDARDRKGSILKTHVGMQCNTIIKFEVLHNMLSL